MATRKSTIDNELLLKVLAQADADERTTNHSEVYKLASELCWDTCGPDRKGYSPSTIRLRHRSGELHFDLKTPRGELNKTGRKRPRKCCQLTAEQQLALRRAHAGLPGAKSRLQRCINGSRDAAIGLKCADCSTYKGEIINCPIEDCALWQFRPFQ